MWYFQLTILFLSFFTRSCPFFHFPLYFLIVSSIYIAISPTTSSFHPLVNFPPSSIFLSFLLCFINFQVGSFTSLQNTSTTCPPIPLRFPFFYYPVTSKFSLFFTQSRKFSLPLFTTLFYLPFTSSFQPQQPRFTSPFTFQLPLFFLNFLLCVLSITKKAHSRVCRDRQLSITLQPRICYGRAWQRTTTT